MLRAFGSALRASLKVMPILSSVLERMGYSYLVCRDQPRGHPSVDPSILGGISPYVTRLPQVLLHYSVFCTDVRFAAPFLELISGPSAAANPNSNSGASPSLGRSLARSVGQSFDDDDGDDYGNGALCRSNRIL